MVMNENSQSNGIYGPDTTSSDVDSAQQADLACAARIAAAGLGIVLLYGGIKKPGILGALWTIGGAALCVCGYTGQTLLSLTDVNFAQSGGQKSSGSGNMKSVADAPSFPDQGIPTTQVPQDDVEEASMASFPASDPPASQHHEAPPVTPN